MQIGDFVPMSSTEKKKRKRKRKTTTETAPLNPRPSELTPIPSLPDDLLLSCFARVSRLYYPTLSLVSKSFRSLLVSPELYTTRASLGHTESCLYVCLRFPPNPNPSPRWFTLCRKPIQTTKRKKKEKSSSEYALAIIPISNYPPAHSSSLVAIGSNIYNIGGYNYQVPSSSVSILDCRSHTRRNAPSMRVARYTSKVMACVLDGKIYVIGGCHYYEESSNWMEVFDPKTQTWELVSSPGAEICRSTIVKVVTIDGKIHIFGLNNCLVYYEPRESSWEIKKCGMYWIWKSFSSCIIDNVIYFYDGVFRWYDTKVRRLGILKGLKGMSKLPVGNVKLADYDGKMTALLDKFVQSCERGNKMICRAVISLEKRNDSREIWGEVERIDDVLKVPMTYEFVHTLASILQQTVNLFSYCRYYALSFLLAKRPDDGTSVLVLD